MVKFMKFLGYAVFFLTALVFFMPKLSLYYYAEKELEKHKIILSKEETITKALSLSLKDASVSYDSMLVGQIESVDFNFFVFYNALQVKNIELSDIVSSFVPLKITQVDLQYNIFNPLYVTLEGKGEFGKVNAIVDLFDKNASLVLVPSKLMLTKYKNTLGMLKKNDGGNYEYAKNF